MVTKWSIHTPSRAPTGGTTAVFRGSGAAHDHGSAHALPGADPSVEVVEVGEAHTSHLLQCHAPLGRGIGADGWCGLHPPLRPRRRDRRLAEHGRTHGHGRLLSLGIPPWYRRSVLSMGCESTTSSPFSLSLQ